MAGALVIDDVAPLISRGQSLQRYCSLLELTHYTVAGYIGGSISAPTRSVYDLATAGTPSQSANNVMHGAT